MEPVNIRFGGGAAETVLHPLVAVVMCLAIVLMFLLPRRYVVVPLLLTALLVPIGQVMVVAGVHFMVVRIMILFGLVRLLMARVSLRVSGLGGGFNRIDEAFSLWAFFYALNFILLWMQTQALIQRLGFLLDVFGMYFLLRFLIRDDQDVHRVIKLLGVVAAIVAVGMIGEQLIQKNVFGLVGGVKSVPEIRDGRIRSQGPFQVSIMAGVFGATLLPLFAGLWRVEKLKTTAILGMISSTVIVYASSSSTPLLAYLAAILALCLWPLRNWMRVIRWGIVITLLALHMVMKAPVWALIARVDVTGSSSGDHRYMLVDNFIRNFSSWWFLGTKDYNTWGWDMWDLSNQFVAYGLTGGLISLVFFVAIISRSFGRIGTARKLVEGDRGQQWFLWCVGAAMFAHIVSYFGVSYWDQMQVAWFILLAMISAATCVAMPVRVAMSESGTSSALRVTTSLSPAVGSSLIDPRGSTWAKRD